MKRLYTITTFALITYQIHSQSINDTTKSVNLKEILLKAVRVREDITRLNDVEGTYIFAGKKNEVINLSSINANITEKTGRQIFAKVPGVFVYDMDGSGNQMNISTRGLDAHRGWEFNIRKDGIITNSDMYGYPASHYSMPMESVERIELVRGTASLQYGAQFGGMLNYVSKKADTTKKISFETINSTGSFGLFSTYNAVGGKVGKFTYYAYLNKRVSNGYRNYAHTDADAEQITLIYEPVKNLHIKAEWARSSYVYRTPGPLTDKAFNNDPTQASRTRNYFNPDMNVPSFSIDWEISPYSKLRFTTSAVIGARNSVLFDKPANVADTINATTLAYNNRQVDIDHFNSYTTELRFLQQYKLLGKYSSLATGFQYMNNDLHRQQLGKGTTGSDFDLTLVQPGWGRDMHLKSQNIALFIENNFKISDNFSINAGARVEVGQSKMSGVISYLPDKETPNTIRHKFPLFGISFDYKPAKNHNFYGGWSQAYRPVIFKDIIPAATYDRADKNLKDAYGYNLEAGYRGEWRFLKWDLSCFELQYNNRLGKLSLTDNTGNFYIFQTNIGNSITKGLEIFIEGGFNLATKARFSLFTSTSYMDAKYQNAKVKSGTGNVNIDVSGNSVESVPQWITRNGLTIEYSKLSVTTLYSYVGQTFADAQNTVIPSANGAVGLVPSYGLLDINTTVKATEKVTVRVNLNNVTNEQYFTKRPLFYPGPGVWPSDGRSMNISVGLKI